MCCALVVTMVTELIVLLEVDMVWTEGVVDVAA